MNTLDDEILADDAPLDVFAENAVNQQHQWLATYDLGHVSSSSRGSAIRYYVGPTDIRWREWIGSVEHRIVYVIPMRLDSHALSVHVRVVGHTRSAAASPGNVEWRAYFGRFPDAYDSDNMSYDASNPSLAEMEVAHPRPGETYDDLLIITLKSGLSDPDTDAWHELTKAEIKSDGRIKPTSGSGGTTGGVPADLQNGVESALYVDRSGWFDLEGSNANAASGPYAFGAAPDDSEPTIYWTPITTVALQGIDVWIEGEGSPDIVPQARMRPNIPVDAAVHAAHELAIRRARDHRRLLAVDLIGDTLIGAETTNTVRWKRAEYVNDYRELMRESIWLDRGAYGRVAARLVVIACTGPEVVNDDVVRDEADFTTQQTFRVRLLQFEDGSATPTEVYSGDQEKTVKAYASRGYNTNHVMLCGVRKWAKNLINGAWHERLEDRTSTNRGTSLRWGMLSEADLQAAYVHEFSVDLDGLDFDDSLPLVMVVDIENDASTPEYSKADGNSFVVFGSNFRLSRFGAYVTVGGCIYWEGPNG